MLRINISLLIILKIIILSVFIVSLQATAVDFPDTYNGLLGKKFPKFNLHKVNDKNQLFSQNILTEHAKVVHFWSMHDKLHKQQQQILSVLNTLGILIVGININGKIPQGMDLPYSICLKDHQGKLANKLNIKTLPATFIVDDKGIIRHHINNELSIDAWGHQVEKAYKSILIMAEVKKKVEI